MSERTIEFQTSKTLRLMQLINNKLKKHYGLPTEDQAAIHAVLGHYFDWAEGIADDNDRDFALTAGAFVLHDLSQPGRTRMPEGDEEFQGLPVRQRHIDITAVRKFVFQKTVELVVPLRQEDEKGVVTIKGPGRFGPAQLGRVMPDGTVVPID